jgi:hypothetical protein
MPRFAIATAAVLVLGGVAFAATGGIQTVKNWFVKLEINGKTTDFKLDENGVGTATVQTDDGGQATIQVRRSGTADADGMTTRINVVKAGPGENQEGTAEIIRRAGGPPTDTIATVADLGDAKPVAQRVDEDGVTQSVYILPNSDNTGSRIFFRTDRPDAESTVKLLAHPPMQLVGQGIEPKVTIGDDGMVTILVDNGGQRQMLKFRSTSSTNAGIDGPGEIRVDMPDGQIKVQVSSEDETAAPR